MSEPQVAVGAVCAYDDALLLIRRGRGPAAGEWSVPGGRVEVGETPHEAVVRETAEETGLEVVVDQFLGWVERIDDGEAVVVQSRSDSIVMFLSGAPIDEPLVHYGPFVMNTVDEINEAIEDFNEGRFGHLRD